MRTVRYFKRRWDESRGDQYDSWGASTWYFEVGDDGYAVRQLDQYDGGAILKFDETHVDDEFGALGEKPLDLEDFAPFETDQTTFENAWTSMVARNRPHDAG